MTRYRIDLKLGDIGARPLYVMEYAARIEKFLLDVLELLDFYSLGNRAALHRYIHLKNKDYVLCKWMDATPF